MRIDMKEMFRTSSSKKKIPSFKELIDCADIEEILSLKPKEGWQEEKLESHAILSPFLTDIFFSEDSIKAKDVLSRIVMGIKLMKSQSEFEDDNQENSTSPTWEELDDVT